MSKKMVLSYTAANSDHIATIKKNISEWLAKQSLLDLVTAFGGKVPSNLTLDNLAKWYLTFSDNWDYRSKQKQAFDSKVGEGARWLVGNDDLSDYQKECALTAAFELGLMDNSEPTGNTYDYIWVLGGAKLSCLLRGKLAHDVITDKHIKPKAVVFLASMRPIGDAEREATNTYAPDAETEFDLCVSSAKKQFSIGNEFSEERYDDKGNTNNSWIIRKYSAPQYEVIIIAAPSSDPQKRRANSADTYEFFIKKFQVSAKTSVLLVTSQIYVPYQHLEAVRTIAVPHKITLDTIGFPPEWGGALQGMNEPSNYLQELRSTIQSIGRFLDEHKYL